MNGEYRGTGNIGESLKRGILGNFYSNMILPVNFQLMKFTWDVFTTG